MHSLTTITIHRVSVLRYAQHGKQRSYGRVIIHNHHMTSSRQPKPGQEQIARRISTHYGSILF